MAKQEGKSKMGRNQLELSKTLQLFSMQSKSSMYSKYVRRYIGQKGYKYR